MAAAPGIGGAGGVRGRAPVVERIVTDERESFLWRCDDYPWERNVWNIHPEFEIHLVRHAAGIALVGDHIERFEPGHLTIVGSNLPHDWVTTLRPGERIPGRDIVLQFHPDRLRGAAALLPECGELGGFLLLAQRGLAFHGETRRLGALLLERMGETRGVRRLAQFLELLATMAGRGEYRVLSSPDFAAARDAETQEVVRRVRNRVLADFAGELRLADLAAEAGMSPSAFSRFFARHVGGSFTDTVAELRVGYACRMLAGTERPVTAICAEAGYANVSNFNRVFKQLRGVTPSTYRRLSQQRVARRPDAGAAPDGLVRHKPANRGDVAPQHA